jgi:ubiquinone/menaquinone biosynthesis C-methylase UbiE
MGVAAHLGIKIAEYDARIRTFIPDYEEMLDVAADALPARPRTLVDVGTGTGALAARCIARAPGVRVVGIDADAAILDVARRRLGDRATFVVDSFLRAEIPACDAVVASFALHHVRTRMAKAALYRRIRQAMRPGARLIVVDCHPSDDPRTARAQFEAWTTHLERAYSPRRARSLLDAWAGEDVYVPLEAERRLMGDAGLRSETLWRKGAFAVLRARR